MNKKTGILLVNLGTPDSPHPRDVYRYLIQFLTDGRVIDVPFAARQLLVRGLIVPLRYRNSARSYSEIWTEEGSPLLVYGKRAELLLQKTLGESFVVKLAMRYQKPSIEKGLHELRDADVSDIVVLPMFPQYASASTGSVHQEVMRIVSGWQVIPKISFVNSYPTQSKMIETFCLNAQKHPLEEYDHFLFSFHGLPEKHILKADRHSHCLQKQGCCSTLSEINRHCYSAQCVATADALRAQLNIPDEKTTVCFQSRLGSDPWIQPFTSDVLKKLAAENKKRVLVFCPAFVADCLETVFEIAVEYREEFIALGGERLDLVESLNDHPLWIEALAEMALAECSSYQWAESQLSSQNESVRKEPLLPAS
jgi:protoporphyrin/coproporphyrin ferrochelatase